MQALISLLHNFIELSSLISKCIKSNCLYLAVIKVFIIRFAVEFPGMPKMKDLMTKFSQVDPLIKKQCYVGFLVSSKQIKYIHLLRWLKNVYNEGVLNEAECENEIYAIWIQMDQKTLFVFYFKSLAEVYVQLCLVFVIQIVLFI